MNTVVCHMTSINNLESIIATGKLLCKNALSKNKVTYVDVANQEVQDKRARVTVTLGPGGNLHNYVPFYFWGQTPMLFVNRDRQHDIIFFATTTKTVAESGANFVFTDRHAVVSYAKFYNNLEELTCLDWQTIKSKYWGNDENDPARKEKKQAEFLVHESVPWDLIKGIAVLDEKAKEAVSCLIDDLPNKPIIKIKQEWYYT